MKTKLPAAITTIEEAKAFLLELHTNRDTFHPEDDATDLEGDPFTKEEGEQLNKLMKDIYDLPGNDGDHKAPAFDPCAYLISIDKNYHMLEEKHFNNHSLFEDIILGDYQGEEIGYVIQQSADPYSTGWIYTLSLSEGDDHLQDYEYNDRELAEADVLSMQNLAGIKLTEI